MKHVVKCPCCDCEFGATFNLLQWQLSEAKRIISKTDEEIENDWDNFLKKVKDEKPR